MPRAQINERGGLTLLALANLKDDTPWTEAFRPPLRIHDIIAFAKEAYGWDYAENTRETIRRQTIHQFEQAGIVVRNEDDPSRPTNSPHNRYALTPEAMVMLRRFQTGAWEAAVEEFSNKNHRLVELYDRRKKENGIEVALPDGDMIQLSAGEHNQLQKDIILKFRPYFAPKSSVLYVGDTAHKMAHIEKETLEGLGMPITEHDKLPDVVLYDPEKNLLLLIEAVTTHGPVTPKRRMEIEGILSTCKAKRVYISAFPSYKEYRKYLADIAWETEVWIADEPHHMIHKNGEKFFTTYG